MRATSCLWPLCLFIFLAPPADAQSPTDAQVQQFVQQAQASGLSETQMEELARTKGYSAADMSRAKQRAGQNKGSGTTAAAAIESGSVRSQNNAVDLSQPPPAVAATPSSVFGASLFTNAALTFEPNLRIPTPRQYQLGPEDELVIDLYGNAQQTYRAKISPEGSIRIENLAPIHVSGLTIEQAEGRVVSRLKTFYPGLNGAGGVFAQVTLGNVRSIRVTLVGQLVRPGTYTLSSLATVFNALYAAGGPSPQQGTFRAVRLLRQNRLVQQLDLYDFLLRADLSANARLMDGDVVFVDHFGPRVDLLGEVKSPGLYELRKGETLGQVLGFAGGLNDRAYTATISLRRNTDQALDLLTIPASQVAQFIPQSGDRYTIGAILERYDHKVAIRGAVFRPGDYDLRTNATLSQLIRHAEGLRADAFRDRATLLRLRPNRDPEVLSVDVGGVLRGEQPDMILQPDDLVQILTQADLRPSRTVSIDGAVNKPGSFEYADSLTVGSLVFMAGGFADGAMPSRIEIARRVTTDTVGLLPGQLVRLLPVSTDASLRLTPADAQLLLQPYDQVLVRQSPAYAVQQNVAVGGEVFFPGRYAILDKNEHLTNLIARAGGIRPDAYLPATRFTRRGEVVAVDLRKILSDPTDSGNLLLMAGDSLTIPRRTELVRVRGEVLNPITVDYNPTRQFTDYLDGAGGLTRKAFRRRIYAVYANGQIQPVHRLFGLFATYPRP